MKIDFEKGIVPYPLERMIYYVETTDDPSDA